ncbi:hypothetical protein [Streptomyces sp. NPDC047928]|uniref:hypothetical protein n=1 Tax=unclassified Streptomyces TaxID=2593676 RepID=UPI00371A340A
MVGETAAQHVLGEREREADAELTGLQRLVVVRDAVAFVGEAEEGVTTAGQGLGVLECAPVFCQPPASTTPRQGSAPGEGVEHVPEGHFELPGQLRRQDRDEGGLPTERLVLILLALLVVRRDGGLHLPDERVVGVDGDVRGLGQVLEHFLGRLQQLSFTVREGGSPSAGPYERKERCTQVRRGA